MYSIDVKRLRQYHNIYHIFIPKFIFIAPKSVLLKRKWKLCITYDASLQMKQ